MSADLTGYLRAVRLYTERARAIYAAAIEEPYTPPNPADFGIREAEPKQENTMADNPTAATIRAAHGNMAAIIAAVIRDQIRIFERETGLEVQGVEVQLATLTSPAGRETLVESVDVRVGLGR